MNNRNYSPADQLLSAFNRGLQTLLPEKGPHQSPAGDAEEPGLSPLSADEQTTSTQLLRVDHSGEVCAQALYMGQALTARDPQVRAQMEQAAEEEADHLRWCQQRLHELDNHSSRLDPLFFAGALSLGLAAGLAGDRWSLGFLAETERQVEAHLDDHLAQLPPTDQRSRKILEQMKTDEARHADNAVAAGAAELPDTFKTMMRVASQLMTQTTRWV